MYDETETLTPKQRKVAQLLAVGFSGRDAAAMLKINEATVYRLRKNPTFQAYLASLLKEVERESLEHLHALRMRAVERLGKLLDCQTDSVALRACEVILDRTKVPFTAQPELATEGEKRAAWAAMLREIEQSIEEPDHAILT